MKPLLSICILLWVYIMPCYGQDGPGPMPDEQTIAIGSIIIPMDNAHQSLNSESVPGEKVFNLKAYGLIYDLLSNQIPVQWVIRSGKKKGEKDFSALVYESTGDITEAYIDSFSSGVFVINTIDLLQNDCELTDDNLYTETLQILSQAKFTDVNYYILAESILADVRYKLTHKPIVGVLSDGQSGGNRRIQRDILGKAGIPYDQLRTIDFIENNACYSFIAQAHIEPFDVSLSYALGIRNFVQSGGNFFAQCTAIKSYNDPAQLMSELGMRLSQSWVLQSSIIYSEADLPIMQFDGIVDFGFGDAAQFRVSADDWKSTSYSAISTTEGWQLLRGADLNGAAPGGNLYFAAGHDYTDPGHVTPDPSFPEVNSSEIMRRSNAQRIFLNAVFIPSTPTYACTIASTCICEGDEISLGCGSTNLRRGFNWSPATDLSCTSCSNPTASPRTTTTYTVTSNNNSCVSSKVTIAVNRDQIEIENVQIKCIDNEKYQVSFKINSDTPESAQVSGSRGELIGDFFTSDSIDLDLGYYFKITDDVSCPLELSGKLECGCYTQAILNGESEFCINPEDSARLFIYLTGESPWTVSYSVDGVERTIVTDKDTVFINTRSESTYSLLSVADKSLCTGLASGTISVKEYLPIAGADRELDICVYRPPLALIDLINSDQKDGTFSYKENTTGLDPLNTATGILELSEPLINQSLSIYYIVKNEKCSGDTSLLTLNFKDCDCIIPPNVESEQYDYFKCKESDSPPMSVNEVENTQILWSTDPSMTPIIYEGTTFTPSDTGTYYAQRVNIPENSCKSVIQKFEYQYLHNPEVVSIDDFSLYYPQEVFFNTFSSTFSGEITEINWYLNDELILSGIESPSLFIDQSGQAIVEVFNSDNCSARDTIEIKFKNDLFLPNAFTPNHDGINDVFKIEGRSIESVSYEIYNRWGDLIFYQPQGVNNRGWDGSFNDIISETGVYIYKCNVRFYSGRESLIAGDVTLLR